MAGQSGERNQQSQPAGDQNPPPVSQEQQQDKLLETLQNGKISLAKLKASLTGATSQYKLLLERILDTEVHEETMLLTDANIVNGHLVTQDHNKDEIIFYYQNIFNLLTDSFKILTPANKFNQNFLDIVVKNKTIFGKLLAGWRKHGEINNNLNELGEAYVSLLATAESLKIDHVVNELLSFKQFFETCKEVASDAFRIETIKKEISENPFVLAAENQKEALNRVFNVQPPVLESTPVPVANGNENQNKPPVPQPLPPNNQHQPVEGLIESIARHVPTLQEALKNISVQLVGPHIPAESVSSINNTIEAVIKIKLRLEEYAKTSQSLPQRINFIIDLFPMVNVLIRDFPQSYVSIQKSLRGDFIKTGQQFNFILRDLFLAMDSLELKYFLKEKYILSLGQVEGEAREQYFIKYAKAFNDWVEGMNYEFKEGERFPYAQSILAQREKMLEAERVKNADAPQSSLRLRFLERRVKLGQAEVEKQAALQAAVDEQKTIIQNRKNGQRAEAFTAKRQAINALIDQRIAELKGELASCWTFFKETKRQEVELLKGLKEMAKPAVGAEALTSFMDQQKLIEKMKGNRPHLLFQGRTGQVVNQIRYVSATRTDEETLLTQREKALKDKSDGIRYFRRFRQSEVKKLADRSLALELLKKELKDPGCDLENALYALQVNHVREYNILIKEEKSTLNEIKKIEDFLPRCLIGKRLIDQVKAVEPAIINEKLEYVDKRQMMLRSQREELILRQKRMEGMFYSRMMNDKEIASLTARIAAYDTFKKWLKNPNYRVDNVLVVMQFSHEADSKALESETLALDGIREIENRSLQPVVAPEAAPRAMMP